MGADATDEEPIRNFMERDRPAENSWKQRAERSQWNQTAVVLDQELSAQISLAILYASPGFIDLELGLDVVVAQTPARSVHLGGDFAERLQELQQTDIIVALSLHNRQGIIRGDRV